MFKISITEGWLDIMWDGVDSRNPTEKPIKDQNMKHVGFFMLFIVLGSWFLLNIFDNITIDNFIKEKQKSQRIEKMKDVQRLWIKL